MVRVAVIGGGIFGCATAIKLHRDGHEVHLFEAKDSLLRCASQVNQFRLHMGYHYPRSPETIQECKASVESFKNEYGQAVVSTGRHYYAIARHGSKTTPLEYLKALKDNELNYRVTSSDHINSDAVDLVIEADEPWIDGAALRGLVWDKLQGVTVHLNTKATANLRDEFDKIVIAAYANTNTVAMELGCAVEPFQFEVCEKPVLKMPDAFQSVGFVIMDGEFCSLDPLWGTPYHVMGHVKHAIHANNTGPEPEIPQALTYTIDAGIEEWPQSDWASFRASGSEFITEIADAEYIGSMFTVRAVLPDRDATDERPTLVSPLDDQVIRVFSGKIGCAVTAAEQVCGMIEQKEKMAA